MNTLADSIKSQIFHVLHKTERLFDAALFLSMKLSPQEQRPSCLRSHLEGSVIGVCVSPLQSAASPPLGFPPALLSPSPSIMLFPFLVILELSSKFISQRRLGMCKTHQPLSCAVCYVPVS